MSAPGLAVLGIGLVTAVGLTAEASCAAIRAKVTNPTETRFIASDGQWIMAHQVALEQPWRGLKKLERMAAMAIDEALADVPKSEWPAIPLLLCVAEKARPGRAEGLDDKLFHDIEATLGVRFASQSAVIAHGRVGVAVALAQTRELVRQHGLARVLVAATDSLLSWPTLSHYERNGRLLSANNSNGFMPGEGAGASLLGCAAESLDRLVCRGIGFGVEPAHIDAEEPLRADGLTQAIRASLADAGTQMHDMDYRITDLSGEQYYFKEAALALTRTLRVRKEEFDIWHPAECTGEAGALAGLSVVAVADSACRKGYSKGHNILAHMSGDAGQRAALSLRFGEG